MNAIMVVIRIGARPVSAEKRAHSLDLSRTERAPFFAEFSVQKGTTTPLPSNRTT